jgi:hypothetical protein
VGRIGKEMSYVMEVQLAWMHYLMLLRTLVWAGQTNPSMFSHLTIFNVTLFLVILPTKTIIYLRVTRNSGYKTDQTSEFVLTLGPEGWDRKRSSRLKHEVFTSILNSQKEAVSDAFAEVRAKGVVYPESITEQGRVL